MKLGVLFSGGKDSIFACRRAMEKNHVACLISLVSENPDSYMFHTPNIRHTDLQAEAIGIPLLTWPTHGVKEVELQDLSAAIAAARDRYGILGIVTGAIESVYQAARVQRICRDQDLWCYNPLWQTNQIDYLRLLLKEGFSIIISGVYAYPFEASWLGAQLTEERIQMLERLQQKYKINPSGEGGELESFVLDGPFFQKRIEILKASQSYANYRGQFILEKMRLAEKQAREMREMSPEIKGEIPDEGQIPEKMGVHRIPCILLVDLCFEKDSLSQYEFVHPIRDTLQKAGFLCNILHYSEVNAEALANYDKIILCGTALKDNAYAEHLQHFSWIKDLKKPILGICAGMQVISAVYGGLIVPHPTIGLEKIEIVKDCPLLGEPRSIEGYHLHNYAATLPDGFLLMAGRIDAVEAFQHSSLPTYGIIFHPEVRSRWILERFANLLDHR
ncbi:MAG TPA: diphthine--ammonia ligase [Methanothrix sp.]|nr:diphthine--ammonia ligase [Methanothrix sp.]